MNTSTKETNNSAGKTGPVNRSALARMLATVKPEMVFVNSAMAQEWLDNAVRAAESGRIRQRRIDPKTVDGYRRDMVDGNWGLSDSMIAVTTDGVPINGRHRLTAVVKSCTSQWFCIVRNAPLSMQAFFDRGKRRTAAQQLDMVHNIEDAGAKINAFRAITKVAFENPSDAAVVTDQEAANRLRRTSFEEAWDGLASIRKTIKVDADERKALHAGLVTAAFLLAWHKNPGKVARLYENFLAGTATLQDDPMKRLRKEVLSLEMSGENNRRPGVLAGVYFLNAALSGRNEVERKPDFSSATADQRIQKIASDWLRAFGSDFCPHKPQGGDA